MKRTRKALASILLLVALMNTACPSAATLNKAIRVMDGIPALVTSFHLSPSLEQKLIADVVKVTNAVKSYRDDPTENNFVKALNLFDSINFSTGNPTWDARLKGIMLLAREIYAYFGPATMAEADPSEVALARKEIEQKLSELDRLVKAR
jgi:hypothetical protein